MDKRKELKLAYKQNPRPMGVFQIKNRINGKIFLGSSMDLPGKLNSCRFQLESKCHPNKVLQGEWATYGSKAFVIEILETINTEKIPKAYWSDAILALEEKWLTNLQPFGERGYHKPKLNSIQKYNLTIT